MYHARPAILISILVLLRSPLRPAICDLAIMESTTAKNNPKDAETMMNILKEMGVNEYEPKVVDLMLEFAYSKFLSKY